MATSGYCNLAIDSGDGCQSDVLRQSITSTGQIEKQSSEMRIDADSNRYPTDGDNLQRWRCKLRAASAVPRDREQGRLAPGCTGTRRRRQEGPGASHTWRARGVSELKTPGRRPGVRPAQVSCRRADPYSTPTLVLRTELELAE